MRKVLMGGLFVASALLMHSSAYAQSGLGTDKCDRAGESRDAATGNCKYTSTCSPDQERDPASAYCRPKSSGSQTTTSSTAKSTVAVICIGEKSGPCALGDKHYQATKGNTPSPGLIANQLCGGSGKAVRIGEPMRGNCCGYHRFSIVCD